MSKSSKALVGMDVHKESPCLFAEEITDPKGKIRKRYPQRLVMTPFEKLATLDNVHQFLRRGVTLESLRRQAARMSVMERNALWLRLAELRSRLLRRARSAG